MNNPPSRQPQNQPQKRVLAGKAERLERIERASGFIAEAHRHLDQGAVFVEDLIVAAKGALNFEWGGSFRDARDVSEQVQKVHRRAVAVARPFTPVWTEKSALITKGGPEFIEWRQNDILWLPCNLKGERCWLAYEFPDLPLWYGLNPDGKEVFFSSPIFVDGGEKNALIAKVDCKVCKSRMRVYQWHAPFPRETGSEAWAVCRANPRHQAAITGADVDLAEPWSQVFA